MHPAFHALPVCEMSFGGAFPELVSWVPHEKRFSCAAILYGMCGVFFARCVFLGEMFVRQGASNSLLFEVLPFEKPKSEGELSGVFARGFHSFGQRLDTQ